MPQSPQDRATVYPGRRSWPYVRAYKWLEARPELSPGARRLYYLLASSSGGSNVARNWTVPGAADALGSTTRSVTTWFRDLAAVGLLERQPAAPGETGHRYWFLAHPWIPALQSEQEPVP